MHVILLVYCMWKPMPKRNLIGNQKTILNRFEQKKAMDKLRAWREDTHYYIEKAVGLPQISMLARQSPTYGLLTNNVLESTKSVLKYARKHTPLVCAMDFVDRYQSGSHTFKHELDDHPHSLVETA